jgi:hypothetical protein
MGIYKLGDQALFLGINQSLSLPARECGFKANNIYFTDDSRSILYDSTLYGGYDLGCYDLEREARTWSPSHDYKEALPPPIWVMPTMNLSPSHYTSQVNLVYYDKILQSPILSDYVVISISYVIYFAFN